MRYDGRPVGYDGPLSHPSPKIGEAKCAQCSWKAQRATNEQACASLYRHIATHYDPVDRREDGTGIAKLKKPAVDTAVWGLGDVDLLCKDE